MKSSVVVMRVLQVDEESGAVGKFIPIATHDRQLMYRRLYHLLSTGLTTNVPDATLDDLLLGYCELYDEIPKEQLEEVISDKYATKSDKVSTAMLVIDDRAAFSGKSDEEWTVDQFARVETAKTLIEMYRCLKKRLRMFQREATT